MNTARISALLRPFVAVELAPIQLDQISTYIDLLLRWNQRMNLTAVREPEEIVTRHFGESLFAARHLFPAGADTAVRKKSQSGTGQGVADDGVPARPALGEGTSDVLPGLRNTSLLDIGSGAGFPGLPIKIWAPLISVTLIESRQKKVAFLREVIRALTLTDIDVFPGRAEDFPESAASIVTLRAVERFDQVLPVAAARLAPGGAIALLIGESQVQVAARLLPDFKWHPPLPIPESSFRAILVGAH